MKVCSCCMDDSGTGMHIESAHMSVVLLGPVTD